MREQFKNRAHGKTHSFNVARIKNWQWSQSVTKTRVLTCKSAGSKMIAVGPYMQHMSKERHARKKHFKKRRGGNNTNMFGKCSELWCTKSSDHKTPHMQVSMWHSFVPWTTMKVACLGCEKCGRLYQRGRQLIPMPKYQEVPTQHEMLLVREKVAKLMKKELRLKAPIWRQLNALLTRCCLSRCVTSNFIVKIGVWRNFNPKIGTEFPSTGTGIQVLVLKYVLVLQYSGVVP